MKIKMRGGRVQGKTKRNKQKKELKKNKLKEKCTYLLLYSNFWTMFR